MISFTDCHSVDWSLEIKMRHIEAVKRLCKDKNGKPVDLLLVIQTGNIEQLFNDIETIVNIAFVLCGEQVKERFDVAAYDASNADMYELVPEWKTESNVIKASRWFGERINGAVLGNLIEAFQEALIDFFPNESRKTALKKIVENQKQIDRIQVEEIEKQLTEMMPRVEAKIRSETKEKISKEVSAALSMNMPES
ncbi:hypothetical protein FACS189443_6510 [Planctomycetales bacterium]|nr:hypothetical protein FACS189443_6510 [Planctomycetales bacterium]